MHLRVKKSNLDIFTCAPPPNSPNGSDHPPPGRGKLLIPPKQRFFKNLFSPQQKGGRNYEINED